MTTPTLNAEEFLLCLAQIGIGFAGFGGLIVSFRHEPGKPWDARDSNALKFLLEHSLGASLFSLVPIALLLGLDSERLTWGLSNVFLARFLWFLYETQVNRIRELKRLGKPGPRFLKQLKLWYMVPIVPLCCMHLLAGFSGYGSVFVYVLGLLFLQFQAAIQFWLCLTRYTGSAPVPQVPDRLPGCQSAEREHELP